MLKELSKAWQKALRQRGAWQRWYRKLPHNRVRRVRIRNEKGETIGYGNPMPIPEPAVSPTFCRKVMLPSGKEAIELDSRGTEAAYRLARYPKSSAEEVMPLAISEEEIRELSVRLSR
jgi:hypothetical protein